MFRILAVSLLVTSCIAFSPRYPLNRIVGGTPVTPGEIPWQVTVQDASWDPPDSDWQGWHFCGGVLIDERWVLTAGQCIPDWEITMQVRLGDHHMFDFDKHQQTILVEKAIRHENYDNYYLENDIGLLKLKSPAVLNDYVQAIKLPTEKYSEPSGKCMISGWGSLYESGICPEILHKVEVPIVTDQECKDAYQVGFFDSMLCAGVPEGGKDACTGDSGGPMACKDKDGEYFLGGVTSFGAGCGRPGYPGVYSQVSYYLDWIHQTMEKYK